MRDRCVEGTCSCAPPRKPQPQPEHPEPLIPAPKQPKREAD